MLPNPIRATKKTNTKARLWHKSHKHQNKTNYEGYTNHGGGKATHS